MKRNTIIMDNNSITITFVINGETVYCELPSGKCAELLWDLIDKFPKEISDTAKMYLPV